MRPDTTAQLQKRTINPRLVHLVVSYLADRDFDVAVCRAKYGGHFLQPLDRDGAISFADFLTLLDFASRRLRDDALAVKIATALPFVATGLHHYIVTNAPTLGHAVTSAAEFTGLVTNSYSTRYAETDDHAWIVYEFRNDMGPLTQFIDLQICALALRARQLMSRQNLNLRIEIAHQEPHSIADFHRALGSDIKFNAPVTRAGFHRDELTKPVPDADPDLYRELVKCGRIMLQLKQREKDIVARVSHLIAEFLPSGNATPEKVSRSLNIGERTLQRELAAASTTFTKIVEDTRKRMSQHYLYDTDLPLTEIAHHLGYSELSAFSRAARSWFGQAPTALRQIHKQQVT